MNNLLWMIFFNPETAFYSPAECFAAFMDTQEDAIGKALYYAIRFDTPMEIATLGLSEIKMTVTNEIFKEGTGYVIADGRYIPGIEGEQEESPVTRLSLTQALERAKIRVWEWQGGGSTVVVRDDGELSEDDVIYLEGRGWGTVQNRSSLQDYCVFVRVRYE